MKHSVKAREKLFNGKTILDPLFVFKLYANFSERAVLLYVKFRTD